MLQIKIKMEKEETQGVMFAGEQGVKNHSNVEFGIKKWEF